MLTMAQLLRLVGFRQDLVNDFGPAMGGVHMEPPGTPTVLSAAGTFAKVSNASELLNASGFDSPENNRLRYIGEQPARAIVNATLSFTCEGNNSVISFALFVNGEVVPASQMAGKYTSNTDVQALTVTAHPTLRHGERTPDRSRRRATCRR
jgi:hypothetical protein